MKAIGVYQAFEYDIECCYPRIILDVLGYDFPQVRYYINDKEQRSKIIGLIFKIYPQLCKIVRQVTNDIIDDYISQIGQEHVLLRKNDGFISTKQLQNTSCSLLDIRLKYEYKVLVINDNKYVGLTQNGTCIVKGLREQTVGLQAWWQDILQNLDPYYVRSKVIEYFTTSNLDLFAIPVDKQYMFYIGDNNERIVAKDYKHILISPNRKYYFQIHILPLLRPLLLDTFQN